MVVAQGAVINHVTRVSSNVKRLAQFYTEMFGFEVVESPKFDFEVMFLKLPSSLVLHLIEGKDYGTTKVVVPDPKYSFLTHHMSFDVSNYGSFVKTLEEKGIKFHEMTLPDGKTKQAFFYDPDGYGLEVLGKAGEQ